MLLAILKALAGDTTGNKNKQKQKKKPWLLIEKEKEKEKRELERKIWEMAEEYEED